jgi:DNA-binding transcriptional regulator YiaG
MNKPQLPDLETLDFPLWIWKKRRTLGLTQAQMARKCHVSLSTLQKWEQRLRTPKHNTIAHLKEQFNGKQ